MHCNKSYSSAVLPLPSSLLITTSMALSVAGTASFLPPLLLSLFFCFCNVLSEAICSTDCHPFTNCNKSIPIFFPFALLSCPPLYGKNVIDCKGNITQFPILTHNFSVSSIEYFENNIKIRYPASFEKEFCDAPLNLTAKFLGLLGDHFRLVGSNITIFKCSPGYRLRQEVDLLFSKEIKTGKCHDGSLLYYHNSSMQGRMGAQFDAPQIECPVFEVPAGLLGDNSNDISLSEVFRSEFVFHWGFEGFDCINCIKYEAFCGFDDDRPVYRCKDGSISQNKQCQQCKGYLCRKKPMVAIIVLSSVLGSVMACLLLILCCNYNRSRQHSFPSRVFLHRCISAPLSSQLNLESSSFYQRFNGSVKLFSYKELQEATNNFSPSNELGYGGFGIVYHGKLHDGRDVAVKRLYEHNYNRFELFMNEVQILSSICHRNLVCLYGCTISHSRGLLLVYEYINNGSVSDHLHGSCAAQSSLAWKVRLSIAAETAEALAYLHHFEPPIIHRDIKTSNVLLDMNFHVKVADFGLSRLLPISVSHVSTMPQGTPGYIDPDYHECYQLTDKSDVYSFGVMLIELISSLPAFDMTRHRHEINLANMAINKIHSNVLHEIVDPTIGFKTDHWVQCTVQAVAELAFRCLSSEKEMRPTMDEVAQILTHLNLGEDKPERRPLPEVLVDESALLKARMLSSPDSVTDIWVSSSTTPTNSV